MESSNIKQLIQNNFDFYSLDYILDDKDSKNIYVTFTIEFFRNDFDIIFDKKDENKYFECIRDVINRRINTDNKIIINLLDDEKDIHLKYKFEVKIKLKNINEYDDIVNRLISQKQKMRVCFEDKNYDEINSYNFIQKLLKSNTFIYNLDKNTISVNSIIIGRPSIIIDKEKIKHLYPECYKEYFLYDAFSTTYTTHIEISIIYKKLSITDGVKQIK